ncbi:hypothetical protein M0R45_035829 [Rubus argutus]|uniref:Uncharacterized protein n=1 Tax=Rubus argutus TaxID=59490 RepID=A0AAW1VY13_RUBAR
MATLPMPVVAACDANSSHGHSRVKWQARLVLETVGKRPHVLDPASKPTLMDTELDFSFLRRKMLWLYLR